MTLYMCYVCYIIMFKTYIKKIYLLRGKKKYRKSFMYGVSKNRSALTGPGSCPSRLSDRARLALRMLPSELGLPLLREQQQPRTGWRGSFRQLGLIMLLLALMWFVRLYLHYCSQWLYLQAIAVPVNKWVCFLWYRPSHTHARKEYGYTYAQSEQSYVGMCISDAYIPLNGGLIHTKITETYMQIAEMK